LPGTDALAYYEMALLTAVKSFITLAPQVVNIFEGKCDDKDSCRKDGENGDGSAVFKFLEAFTSGKAGVNVTITFLV